MNKQIEKCIYCSPLLDVIEVEVESVIAVSKTADEVIVDGNTGFGDEPGFSGGRSAEYRRGWDNGR